MSNIPSDLREMLYLDLASGKLNWTLGFDALIFSLILDARSIEAKIEEIAKLGGKGNEIARLNEELTDYRRCIIEFEDQLKELTQFGYAIGNSSKGTCTGEPVREAGMRSLSFMWPDLSALQNNILSCLANCLSFIA